MTVLEGKAKESEAQERNFNPNIEERALNVTFYI